MGRSLRADIIIGGKADSSFYALGDDLQTLGDNLQTLGNYINAVSEKLIQFGEESVDAYVSYEDAMLSTENALSTQYTSASELSQVMEQLNDAALEWASNSTFDTDDVAEAISEAAHSGWDLNQIMEGIPAAMNIAKAGGMDLATGLQYLVDISNAAGVGFEDLGTLVDYWAYAADSSSTTIPEMGEAMQKMGATMQFVNGDMAGLTTMLAILADNGTKGSEAGTLLRNAMLRIIAPTQAAAEAMDLLDLSSDELSEIYSDTESLEKANEVLEAQGFSAYDASGNLKNFTEIWTELAAAVGDMSEEDKYDVLSAIFPTRTITGALALLDAFGSEAGQTFYDAVLSNADGYTEQAAENMESGLGGSLRHLESTYNALQTRTGSELADDVSTVSDSLSGLIEAVNGLDDASFSALVTGLEGIAALGPSLIVAGSGFKVIGTFLAMPTWAKVTVAAGAVAALTVAVGDYLDVMADEQFEAQFGTNSFDESMLGSYISGMTEEYTSATDTLNEFNEAVQASVEQYQEAAKNLTSGLATAAVTGKTLTEDEKQQFYNYGEEMGESVLEGLQAEYDAAVSAALFISDDPAEGTEAGNTWSSIMEVINLGYADAISEAEEMSQGLKEALTSAFEDGTVTEEERQGLLNWVGEYNELMSQIQSADLATDAQLAFEKAQTLGLNGIEEAATQVAEGVQSIKDSAWEEYSALVKAYNRGVATGEVSQEQADEELTYLKEWLQTEYANADAEGDRVLTNMVLSSDVDTGMYGALRDMAESVLYGDGTFSGEYFNYSPREQEVMQENLAKMVDIFGGEEEMANRIQTYADAGLSDIAQSMQTILAMYQMSTGNISTMSDEAYSISTANGGLINAVPVGEAISDIFMTSSPFNYDYLLDAIGDSIQQGSAEAWEQFYNKLNNEDEKTEDEKTLEDITDSAKVSYDLDAVEVPEYLEAYHDEAAMYQLLTGAVPAENYRRYSVDAESAEAALGDYAQIEIPVDAGTEEAEKTVDAFVAETDGTVTTMTLDVDSAQFEETINSLPELMQAAGSSATVLSPTLTLTGLTDEELEATGVQVNVDGDTKELAAKIEAEDAQTLVEYLDGETSLLNAKILSEDGQTLTEIVDGDISQLESAISSQNGKVITVWVRYKSSSEPSGGNGGTLSGYAEGGRATTTSIFGEAGPEWAIPEEHSQRTAELLQSAAEASGFTWPELLSRTGGLNAGNNLSGYTLVYSPTIIAQDANGVEQKLTEDKKRLEKWMQDRMLRESLEVYA